ncbi:IbrB-like domain-containing protein [Streptomyces xiamenensis]|uniref:IbrB-like domain-containing protein n=1 Tax=Streptomyces xiamenensis TaxID=408015 RepID=UPI0035DE6D6B
MAEQLDLLADTQDDTSTTLLGRARELFAELDGLPEDQRMDLINQLRLELHQHSPMREEPVDCVLWVRNEQVHGNDYNPNFVAPPEMKLLEHSIGADGYTQPIVAWPTTPDQETQDGPWEVVDGFHRHLVGKESAAIRERVKGRLPIAVIRGDRSELPDRMAATVRHNRARGKHTVDGTSELILHFARIGKSDEWIAHELGMQPDAVLKYKQVQGLAEGYADEEFSDAWEPDHDTP